MKARRQQEILRIIEGKAVETQDQLLAELRASGLQATQATISRDIKELHLIKEPVGSGAYRYRRAAVGAGTGNMGRLKTIFKEGALSLDAAQNIVVVKAMPGLASAVATAIDGMEIENMLGTVAGDDTVILVMRTGEAAQAFCDETHRILSRN